MFLQAFESVILFIRLIFLTFFIFLNERMINRNFSQFNQPFNHFSVFMLTDISLDFGFRAWLFRVINHTFLSIFLTFFYYKLRLLHKRSRLRVACGFSLGFVSSLWNSLWIFVHLHLFWKLPFQRSSIWSKLHQAKVFLDNYLDLVLSLDFQSLGVYVTDKVLISYKIFIEILQCLMILMYYWPVIFVEISLKLSLYDLEEYVL